MAAPPDRAFSHMRISETAPASGAHRLAATSERRTPSPFPMHKPDLRVDLSSLHTPAPPPTGPPPGQVHPLSAQSVAMPTQHPPRPSPQLSQEPPSVPSSISPRGLSPRLSPRGNAPAPTPPEKNNKFTFHFPPPILNPFGGSTVGVPTQYQLDSALPARGEQTVIFFPMVNPQHTPTPPQSQYGSPASPQLSPRGPKTNKDGTGRARALTEGPPVSPRGSSSSSQSSNPTSPRNRRANSLSPSKPQAAPYSVFKMRVHGGKLEDASKPRAGRHRRGAANQANAAGMPESDPALDLPFPAPPGMFQICQPDTQLDLMGAVAEEPPLDFLVDDDTFMRQMRSEPAPMPLPLAPMDSDLSAVPGAHVWYAPAAADQPPPETDDFWSSGVTDH